MTADLKTFIRRAMARGERIDVGQFQLLNFAAVREQAGERWPDVRKKVFTSGEQFLAKRLGPEDAVIPCEEGFLVLFAQAPLDAARMLAELGDALMTFFTGQPATATVAVESSARRVDAQTITRLAAAAPSTAEPPRSAGQSPGKSPDEARPALLRPRPVSACADNEVLAHFRPLWDAQKQMITANACLAKVVVSGRALEGRRAISTRMSTVSQIDLDICALDTAVTMINALARKQKRMTIRVALHASSWAARDQRAALVERLTELPEPLRKSLLVRFDGLEQRLDVQAGALAELGRSGVGLVAEIPFGTTDLDAFDGCGVSLFSCASPPPVNANSEGLMDHDARTLNRLVNAASGLKAATYLHDVRDLLVLKAAMAVGVRFFSGQAVVADRETPAPSQPLTMVDLYRMHKAA